MILLPKYAAYSLIPYLCEQVRHVTDLFLDLCIGGASPHHLIESLSLPLFTLSKSYIDWTTSWIQQCLNNPNFPTSSAKRHHRETLLKVLTAKQTSRSSFKDHVNTFSLACREPISKENYLS
ncbi:unnamed protein product [Rotaria sp. Silwood2]|nr:unnamed protein product [Rotaria sp. Silwood2]